MDNENAEANRSGWKKLVWKEVEQAAAAASQAVHSDSPPRIEVGGRKLHVWAEHLEFRDDLPYVENPSPSASYPAHGFQRH